jgi:predicted RNA-binding Zn-ribbon protein involved in translation (DUF1610 family)
VTSRTRAGYVNYITTTLIPIGYRIYSVWKSQLQQVTIAKTTIALAASRIPLTELHWSDVFPERTHFSVALYNTRLTQWKHWSSYCWLPGNAIIPGRRAYPWKCPTCGCLATTRAFKLRSYSNDSIPTNMSQYFFYWNRWRPRTLLQLKLVRILMINLFLT